MPGAREWAEQDLVPLGRRMFQAGRDIRNALAPASASKQAGVAARSLREAMAWEAQRNRRAEAALADARRAAPSLSSPAGLDFYDRMERGEAQPTPALENVARPLRQALDDGETQLRAAGRLQSFIENYMPHIYEQPEQAGGALARMLAGKRPFGGPKSFLRQRTIPTLKDAIAAGLRPVTDNPVEMALLKIREQNKALMAWRVVDDLKPQGLIRAYQSPRDVPDGWIALDGPSFDIYERRETTKADGSPGAPEWVHHGHYYAPEDVARVINNHLSPGLRGKAAYDLASGANNLMNAVQLVGAFHAGMSANTAALSNIAIGLERLSRGDYTGAYRVAQGVAQSAASGVHPLAGVAASMPDLAMGSRVYREYMRPGTYGGEIQRTVDALVQGGGRAEMDPIYKNQSIEGFLDALHSGNYPGAALRVVPAAVELAVKPIFEFYVPRLKLAAFHAMAQMELERLGPDATVDQQRQAFARAWDSVDNRFGLMVYDNLFIEKTLKDAAHLAVRAVGWNVGTAREGGGGLLDTATMPKRVVVNARERAAGVRNLEAEPAVTHRMAGLASIAFSAAIIGAVYQYLHTGHGPKELRDYFYPRTGRVDQNGDPERAVMPTYMKDLYPLAEGAVKGGVAGGLSAAGKVAMHKTSPLVNLVGDTISNRDFYGNQVRNADDPAVQQLGQILGHAISSMRPFGIEAYERSAGTGLRAASEAAFGVSPAPAAEVRTNAENLMAEYLGANVSGRGRTPEEFERSQLRADLLQRARRGESIDRQLGELQRGGQLTFRQAQAIRRDSRLDPRQVRFRRLSTPQALQVWGVSTTAEREIWREPLRERMKHMDVEDGIRAYESAPAAVQALWRLPLQIKLNNAGRRHRLSRDAADEARGAGLIGAAP